MLYRYELSMDGCLQDIGILQGLQELHLDHDEEEFLLFPFDFGLPIPNTPMSMTKSFFTESGKMRFKREIRMVIGEYEDEGTFDVILGTLDESYLDSLEIAYRDDYQVVIKMDSDLTERINWDMDHKCTEMP